MIIMLTGERNKRKRTKDWAKSIIPGLNNFAVIVKLSNGEHKVVINDRVPDGTVVVAVWNGVTWIDLEEIQEAILKIESQRTEEWEDYLIEWQAALIQSYVEACKKQWEDFVRHTREQLIEKLTDEHREFEIRMDPTTNANMDTLMQ